MSEEDDIEFDDLSCDECGGMDGTHEEDCSDFDPDDEEDDL